MASQYDPSTFGWQNFYSAVLQSDITSGSLTLTLDTVPASTAGILVIEPDASTNREVIYYTSKGASTITCPADGRGWNGSTAVAHLTGSTLIMADVASYFAGLSDGTLSADPLRTASFFDFILGGTGVVAISAGLVGTFSNITFWLNGRRYVGTSIANKTYTASKDTYVDVTGNSDGSITVAYNEVANNAASPALTTNYLRVAIVTTSGSAITNVNQGQENQIIPIASSIPYAVTDSLGNLICPRDPNRKVLGYKQITGTVTTTSATAAQIAGLSCPVIVPTSRKVKITVYGIDIQNSGANQTNLGIWDGVPSSGTRLAELNVSVGANLKIPAIVEAQTTPASTSKTYNAAMHVSGSTGTLEATSTAPAFIRVELV